MRIVADFLIWALVAFPLLTGGIWLTRPGSNSAMRFELTEPAVPVLIVALLVGLISWRRHESTWVTELSSARFFTKLWNRWQAVFTARPYQATWIGVGVVGTLWSVVALRRHWAGESEAFDLGIFTQAMWSFTQGHGWVSSLKDGVSLFADHQSPVFLLFAPLFWVLPRPETLLVVQAFLLASGAVAFVALVRQESDSAGGTAANSVGRTTSESRSIPVWLPAALPVLYWAYPAIRAANVFDFHPEVAMLPFFLFALAGLQSKRVGARIWGGVALLLALGCKESAGPVACGIGLAWVLGAGPSATRAFTRKVGWVVGALGLAVFLFDILIVPRWAGAGGYAYGGAYSYLRGGGLDFAHALPLWPRARFLFFLLLPLGCLPLFGSRTRLWASVPGLLMLFLTEGDHRLKTIFHYGIEPSIGLFWAAASVRLRPELVRFRLRITARSIGWAVALLAVFSHGRSDVFRMRRYAATPRAKWIRSEVIPALSPSTSLAATSGWVPHLALREWVHFFPEVKMPGDGTVACIFLDAVGDTWPIGANEAEARANQLVVSGAYRDVWTCDGLRVLERVQDRTLGRAEQGHEEQDRAKQACFTSAPACPTGS